MKAFSIMTSLAVAGSAFAASTEDTSREKIRELCLNTYVSGMTKEIASEMNDQVGPSSVKYLQELLFDCAFPRRDNVVAYLGFLSDGEALIDALTNGSCAEESPENYRVELLLPHVLGHVAQRGYGRAKAVLLDALAGDGNGGALYKAAQRATNKDTRLEKLAKQALLGLRECASTDPDMDMTLKMIASGEIAPAWMPQSTSSSNLAETATSILSEMSPTKDQKTVKRNKHGIFDHNGGLRRKMAEDSSNDSHRFSLDFANHVDLDIYLTAPQIDQALDSITKSINTQDYSSDVACCVTLGRDRPVKTFGTHDDSLDVINTEEEQRSVMRDSSARIKVVSSIGYCYGNTGTNILGCADRYGITITAYTSNMDKLGRLIAHEFGHHIGLGHENDARQIMNPMISNKDDKSIGLTTAQCAQFHNPDPRTEITAERLGSCSYRPDTRLTAPGCNGGTVVDFERGTMEGWTNSGSCTQGQFEVDKPDFVEHVIRNYSTGAESMLNTQPDGDHTSGNGYALFTTHNGGGQKTGDVDGGLCVTTSPEYEVTQESMLSLWYFFGQRDSGDDAGDFFKLEASLNGGNTWRDLMTVGDKNSRAAWKEATIDYIPAGSKVILKMSVSDGTATTDHIEAGIDDIRICPSATKPTCIVADFEGGTNGWENNGSLSDCTTGMWSVGTPQATSSRGVKTQLKGDHTTGNGYAFFTAPNQSGSAGREDVDAGVCVADSPVFKVDEESDVSVWYYHGQRTTGDDEEDYFNIEISTNGGATWGNLINIGDESTDAAWTEAKTRVPANSDVKFRVHASDGTADGDVIEAGIDDIEICTASATCSTFEDFEGGMGGWTNSALSDCRTGNFVVGTPGRVRSRGVTTQVAGDHTYGSSGSALFTAPNSSSGTTDVDKGTCIVESPVYNVERASSLSMWYFHGQRNAGDDAQDFFQLEISRNGGRSWTDLVNIGDVQSQAQWTQVRVDVEANDQVMLRMSVSDGDSTGDLIEAGIDDVRICPK